MRIKYVCVLLTFVCFACKGQHYTEKEKQYIALFENFKNDLPKIDEGAVDYFVINYLFVNSKADSADRFASGTEILKPQQKTAVEKQLKTFNRFTQQQANAVRNIQSIPIRLWKDKTVYDQLTTFQKENCLVVFNSAQPKKAIAYMLFIPPIKNKIAAPKIWSWTLTYQFGKFMFQAVTGEEGLEYIFGQD